MISKTMYELLKVRYFDAPPEESVAVAGVLKGDSTASITTSDGDVLTFGDSGSVSFNGIPVGSVYKISYDLPRLSVELLGEVQDMAPPQLMKWSVRF